jgi:putative glutamine amidotransferase
MQCKPLIGINTDFRPATQDRASFLILSSGYFDCVIAAGGIPVLVPPLDDEDDLCCVLENLQGFVLAGGPDLDPERDGFMRHPSVRPMDGRREEFDRMLVRQLIDRRMPVFGIGVGMQLLNVGFGGDLFFHVPEDVPRALPHKDQLDPSHRHGLDVEPGSLMERVYGDGEVRVNSMHHMALDKVAPGFAVTGRCPDGVVEAIESQMDDWFAIGTQFHPEANSASALDQRIFDEFVGCVTGSELVSMKMVA